MTYLAAGPARRTNAALVMTLMMTLTIVPQAQGQPPLPDDTAVQTAVPERQSRPQDSVRLKVQDEMADWRRKMQTFDDTMETSTRRHSTIAEARLRDAWNDTEIEARNVQAATARDWDRTKRAYDAASHRMAVAWDKAHR